MLPNSATVLLWSCEIWYGISSTSLINLSKYVIEYFIIYHYFCTNCYWYILVSNSVNQIHLTKHYVQNHYLSPTQLFPLVFLIFYSKRSNSIFYTLSTIKTIHYNFFNLIQLIHISKFLLYKIYQIVNSKRE